MKWTCKTHTENNCCTKLPCTLDDGVRSKKEQENIDNNKPCFCIYRGGTANWEQK